jgi:hypothetical protein
MDISRLWLGYAARLSQFGSQFAGPQSQTHALAANHSCEVRHDGQNVRLKKNRHGTEGRTVNVRAGGNGFPHLGAKRS